MLRPPKAAAPLRRRCLSCFGWFTGGQERPASSPSPSLFRPFRPLPVLSPAPLQPLPRPRPSLADGPSLRLPRETAVFAADITDGLTETVWPKRSGRIGRAEFESVPERPLAGLSGHGNRPLRSKAYIYLTVVFSKLPSSIPTGGAPRPAANVCYFGGVVAFFHKNRCGTSPREIDPPAPFSGGFSFSEQNAGVL